MRFIYLSPSAHHSEEILGFPQQSADERDDQVRGVAHLTGGGRGGGGMFASASHQHYNYPPEKNPLPQLPRAVLQYLLLLLPHSSRSLTTVTVSSNISHYISTYVTDITLCFVKKKEKKEEYFMKTVNIYVRLTSR